MRHFYLFLVIILFSISSYSQEPFVITWEASTSNNLNIIIPTEGEGYDYTIDFGDGTVMENVTGTVNHHYSSAGIYTVSIYGDFPRIKYSNWSFSTLPRRLLSIEQWGNIQWQSMEEAFYGCQNLVINATDAPNLSQVTSMKRMFFNTHKLNQSINHWDTSNVIDMSEMFNSAMAFNQPLDNWDTSNVVDMSSMFERTNVFNQSIGNWNVSNVINMSKMFHYAELFNQSMGNWDVGNVTNMSEMFYLAKSFDKPLNNWNVSNVTTMQKMFQDAVSFNHPIGSWNVSNVTNMHQMFYGAHSFNQPLNNWNTNTLNNVSEMFREAKSFNQPLDNWNMSNVTNTISMFAGATNFNSSLNNWDISQVTNMSSMFYEASNFNQPIGNWDVSNVTNMNSMFSGANKFNQPIGNWNVSNVTNMSAMFFNAVDFNQNINNWNVSNVISMHNIFAASELRPKHRFNQPLDNWNVSNVTNMGGMFYRNEKFNQSIENWDVYQVTNMSGIFKEATAFNQSLNNWNVSNVSSMTSMFENAQNFNQPLNDWNVSQVTNMSYMFKNANSFNQDISNWSFNSNINLTGFLSDSGTYITNYELLLNRFVTLGLENRTLGANGLLYCDETSRVHLINAGWTITGDALLVNCNQVLPEGAFVTRWEVKEGDLDIHIPTSGSGYNYFVDFGDGNSASNVTGSITHTYDLPGVYTVSITGIFPRLRFGSSIYPEKIKSVEQWGDIQWQSMSNAFRDCINVRIHALDAPDLSQVTDLTEMFSGAESFNQSINHWNVSNITNMSYMFRNVTSFNQPLDNWDVSNVTNMQQMFFGATSFNQSLNDWETSSLTNVSQIFFDTKNFNQPLDNWDISNIVSLAYMFQRAWVFNQPLSNWDVSHITNMSHMFSEARSFNQPLDEWNVSNVISMQRMFGRGNYGISCAFNQPINNWDVSNVTDLSSMFYFNEHFNQPLNNWDVSNVINMVSMFREAKSFNQPLDNWNVSNVANMSYLFAGSAFNHNINNWNVANVTDMTATFSGLVLYNHPLDNWDISNVTSTQSMLSNALAFNQPLDMWNTSNVENMQFMFRNAMTFNQPINNWNVSNVTNMYYMFNEAISFNQPLDSWDVSNVTSMSYMFNEASSFNQNLSSWQINIGWLQRFVSDSGLDRFNYDALLNRLAIIGFVDGNLGAHNLFYCNESARDYLTDILDWSVLGDDPSYDCYLLTGTVLYDIDNNGCEPTDIPVNGAKINAYDGVNNYATFSINGQYSLYMLPNDEFTVSIIENPEYFTVSPNNVQINFSNSSTEIVDFCLTANQSIEDLNITILPINEARPGFESDYRIVVRNVGTEIIPNTEVTFTFDDAMQEFVSAEPNPDATTVNSLTFNTGEILPFGIVNVDITMQTFQPPIVEGGDILNFTAVVTPDANDYTPEDNLYELEQIVVNSFDPNDKLVLQGDEVHIDNAHKYLDYIIRFQNTGTASAINVRILDTLHPKLNYSTFTPISASHDYYIQITNENNVEFIFNNIHLPHEGANEPESHGYVAFKIKPKSDVQVGDIISGDAAIYFDFNPPIITDMVYTEFVEYASINENNLNQILVYPNPAKNLIHIRLSDFITMEEVIMYNIQGRETLRSYEKDISLENLESGIYIVKILTNQGDFFRKIVKQSSSSDKH